MEVDTAFHVAKEVAHYAEEAIEAYDKVEAYKVCGQSLREAYVGMKRFRQEHSSDVTTATPPAATGTSSAAQAPTAAEQRLSADCPADCPDENELSEVESKFGPSVLSQLERSIAREGFAEQVRRARECPHSDQGTEELDALLGSYVVVSKEDAVEAMASYLAAWLSTCPEAQGLEPKKLQKALLTSVQGLKKTKFRQVLMWGRYAYRGATLAYSAFMIYENPWLVRAVATALWSAGTVLCQML